MVSAIVAIWKDGSATENARMHGGGSGHVPTFVSRKPRKNKGLSLAYHFERIVRRPIGGEHLRAEIQRWRHNLQLHQHAVVRTQRGVNTREFTSTNSIGALMVRRTDLHIAHLPCRRVELEFSHTATTSDPSGPARERKT